MLMGKSRNYKLRAMLPWLLAAVLLAGGCESICNKRLYIFRDTPEKGRPLGELALLVTHPDLANGVLGAPNRFPVGGCQWAKEQPSHPTDVYTFSVEAMDGRAIYQGLCMDTRPTYVCEVAAGTRRVRVRMEIWGPQGREAFKDEVSLSLEPGKCYFLQPDCEAFRNRHLQVKLAPLGTAYNSAMRSRVLAWQKQHVKGAALED